MKTIKTYKVLTSFRYKKGYKKMAKRGLNVKLLDEVVYKLSHSEKLDKKYKDHILKGKYKGFHECHIRPDWLLVYKIQDDMLILTLVDTGSHADLFDL